MALSPAKRHFQQVTAAQAAEAAGPADTMEGLDAYDQQRAQLLQDQLRLKQVQSTEGKCALKAQLLPAYAPYVQGVLEAGQGAQDEVLITVMLWHIDAGAFAEALPIAEYVLKHGLKMPDRFSRTAGTVIAEEVAEAALKAFKAGNTFDVAILAKTEELTAEQDMPDQARAKLNLAMGKAAATQVNEEKPDATDAVWLEAARRHLARAIELHSNCGGKKDMERVDRLLKKHAGTAS